MMHKKYHDKGIDSKRMVSLPKGARKFLSVALLAIVIISGITLVLNNTGTGDHLVPMTSGVAALSASGVTTTLNTTFTDVSYITEPTQFEVNKTSGYYMYNDNGLGKYNETFFHMGSKVTSENSTYLIFNTTGSGAFTDVAYNYSHDAGKNTSYFYTAQKFAYNGTGGNVSIMVANNPQTTNLSNIGVAGTAITTADKLEANVASIGETGGIPRLYVYKAGTGGDAADFINTSVIQFTSHNGFSGKLLPLQFYTASIYVYANGTKSSTGDNISATIYAPNNGTILGTAIGSSAYLNYSSLNVTEFALNPTGAGSGAGVFDWAYVVNHNTYVSTPVTSSVTPFVTGTLAQMKTSTSAPFDPSSASNTSFHQSPNLTKVLTNSKIGQGQFSSVVSAQNTSMVESAMVQLKDRLTNLSVGERVNGTKALTTDALLNDTSSSQTSDISASVFNSAGIEGRYNAFLKNYTAINTDGGISANNIRLISYTPTEVIMSTQFPGSVATGLRNAFLNEYPSILSASNMSLTNTSTGAIVAGAFAGDFYYQGMAFVPTIHDGQITNPINNMVYSSVSAAGFASGSFIAGGSVVVPQLKLIGWDMGTPVFASGTVSANFNLFNTLTSAGSAVGNFFSGSAKTISTGIGSVPKVVSNYVIKPIGTSVSAVTKNFNQYTTDTSSAINSIMPTVGVVTGNISKDISGGIFGINSGLNSVSGSLIQFKNVAMTDLAAGYNGVTQVVSRIGQGVQNLSMNTGSAISSAGNSIINTLGNKVSDAQAVLSPFFTSVKNIPGQVAGLAGSVYSKVKSSVGSGLNLLDSIGTTFINTTRNGVLAVDNLFGGIGHSIINGASSVWSFVTSFAAKVGYVLEIVGITIAVIVIVGLIIFFWRKSEGGIPGETKI